MKTKQPAHQTGPRASQLPSRASQLPSRASRNAADKHAPIPRSRKPARRPPASANPASLGAPPWPPPPAPSWPDLIPNQEWDVYRSGIDAARTAQVPFLIGGAFGLASYTGRWRNTKDLDFYILPEHRDRLILQLSKNGFTDLHPRQPYDRAWIYRAARDNTIVDLIWAMANQRSQVEPSWFEHSHPITLRGEALSLMPAEELLWCKLYVLQKDRCDWPDIFNLLHAAGPHLDFARLATRLQGDAPLLLSVLTAFNWVSRERASAFLPRAHDAIQAALAKHPLPPEQTAVRLLDSRPWFAAYQPPGEPMKL